MEPGVLPIDRPAHSAAVPRARYLMREAGLSALINGAISIAFFVAVFGAMDPIPVWGIGNYAFDFIPQSFAVSLMSALVPGLLARKALTEGKVGDGPPPALGLFTIRTFAWALCGLVAGAGVAALLLSASGLSTIPSAPAFAIKILFGALLGAAITHRSVAGLIG